MKDVEEEHEGSKKLCRDKRRKSGEGAQHLFHSTKDLSSGSVWPF